MGGACVYEVGEVGLPDHGTGRLGHWEVVVVRKLAIIAAQEL